MSMESGENMIALKQELKCWESMFARKYGRKPTKGDINESSAEIRDSYKKYAKLKKEKQIANDSVMETSTSEGNNTTVKIDGGVFGADLNKKATKVVVKAKSLIKHDSSTSWRPKLKPMKRPVVANEETADDGVISKHFDVEEVKEQPSDEPCMDLNLSIASLVSQNPSRRLSSGPNHIRRRRSLIQRSDSMMSMEWIESCKESLIEPEKNNAQKKEQPMVTGDMNTPVDGNKPHYVAQETNSAIASNEKENLAPHREPPDKNSPEKVFTMEDLVQDRHKIPVNSSQNVSQAVESTNSPFPGHQEKIIQNKENKKETEMESCEHETTNALKKEQNKLAAVRKARCRTRQTTQEQAGNAKDDVAPDVSSSSKAPSTKSKAKGKRKREETDNENTEDVNTKKVKLPKKAADKGKRLVSNNFVKIDLRKKTYVRGLKKTSVSALKRRSWRSKTSFEHPGQSGKCFKCGGEGHWAKFCRGKPKRVDPFKKLDTEKQSLEHAALFENKGSCFDGLYTEPTEGDDGSGGDGGGGGGSGNTFKERTNKFTINDIMPIEPCWPRTPYTLEIHEDDIVPLCAPDGDSPSKEAYKKVKSSLKTFGFTEFREGQQEATARVISGLSTLVILATGSGKSLCYQLPAYMYFTQRQMITIVVSPLVALMQDQLVGLPDCLPGAALNSNMTKLQKQKVVTKLKEGKIAILLVSPEALVSGAFGTGILPPKSALPPIAFACIDEAHCLSEWSHNFRPSYLKVCKVLREHYQIKCLLGLTATASTKTAKSVTQHLGVPGIGSIIRDPSPIPENLWITASRDDNRDVALVELLQEKPFDDCDSIIIYVTRRNDADRLAILLRTSLPDFVPKNPKAENNQSKAKSKGKGRKTATKPTWWNCEAYHAGLTPAQRKRVQTQFMASELRIVVATVAFGMGLDKSDVRSVIHYNMPKSFENFVQEIGRAGRDGKPSYCHVFLADDVTDLCELKRHVYGDTVDRRTIKQFVDMLFPPCECNKLYEQHQSSASSAVNSNDNCTLESFQQKLDDCDLDMFFSEEFDFEDTKKNENEGQASSSKNQKLEEKGENFKREIPIGRMDADSIGTRNPLKNDIDVDNCNTNSSKENTDSDTDAIDFNVGTCESRQQDSSNSKNVECEESSKQPPEPNGSSNHVECEESIKQSPPIRENPEDTVTKSHCSGHRVALPIDRTVKTLDVREEILSTMLAYLELHSKKWLQVFNPLRSFCAVKCYGGPEQYQLLLKKFAPVAIATKRLLKEELRHLEEHRQIEFDLVEIADVMCWDILTVVRELKSLQWNMSFALDAPLNETGKSGIIVETDALSFHFTTAAGIGDDERDEICDYICDTITDQEETRLLQLNGLYSVLKDLSCQHYWQVPSDRRIDHKAREQVGQFFLCNETQQTEYLRTMCTSDTEIHTPARRWNNIAGDIRALINSYPDEDFSARTVARIFQGIESPCYPAITYGRDRRFWRQYLDVDFNELRKFAVREVAKFKS